MPKESPRHPYYPLKGQKRPSKPLKHLKPAQKNALGKEQVTELPIIAHNTSNRYARPVHSKVGPVQSKFGLSKGDFLKVSDRKPTTQEQLSRPWLVPSKDRWIYEVNKRTYPSYTLLIAL